MPVEQSIQEIANKIQACDTSKPYIYVSYSTRDGRAVYSDVVALQEMGKNLWIDVESNMTGDGYNSTIFGAIKNENCKGVLFYLSEDSMTSAQSAKEVAYTKSHAVTDERAALPVVVVDLLEVKDLDIEKYVNGELYAKYKDEALSPAEAERMKKYSDKYNNRVDRVSTKYDLADVILSILKGQEAGQVPFEEKSEDRTSYVAKML